MDEVSRFLRPIPPYTEGDWGLIPPIEECGEPLVDMTDLHPRARYGAAYLSQGLPGALDRCLVRRGVWERMLWALEVLPEEYSLLIFDGLRPLAVQQAIYEQFRDAIRSERPGIEAAELELLLDRFVAKPVKKLRAPAPHATGGAVDLTLCLNGKPLNMGTGFDSLTNQAHTDWFEKAHTVEERAVRDNRRLLYHAMLSAGFVNYGCEWWHYSYGDRQWARQKKQAPLYGFCSECDFP